MELVNVNFPTPRPERDGWQLGGIKQLLMPYVIEDRKWKGMWFGMLWKEVANMGKGAIKREQSWDGTVEKADLRSLRRSMVEPQVCSAFNCAHWLKVRRARSWKALSVARTASRPGRGMLRSKDGRH
jgi:hypothetical protein